MKNIFKRRKKPLIIAPTKVVEFPASYVIPIPNSSDRILMSGKKMIIDCKTKPFENQTKLGKRRVKIMIKENLPIIFGAIMLLIVLITAVIFLISIFTKKDNTFALTITDQNGNVSKTVIHENLLKAINVIVLPNGSVECDFDTIQDADLVHMED